MRTARATTPIPTKTRLPYVIHHDPLQPAAVDAGRPFPRGRPAPEPWTTGPGAASAAEFGPAATRAATASRHGRHGGNLPPAGPSLPHPFHRRPPRSRPSPGPPSQPSPNVPLNAYHWRASCEVVYRACLILIPIIVTTVIAIRESPRRPWRWSLWRRRLRRQPHAHRGPAAESFSPRHRPLHRQGSASRLGVSNIALKRCPVRSHGARPIAR